MAADMPSEGHSSGSAVYSREMLHERPQKGSSDA
jgi:hypothetical protein